VTDPILTLIDTAGIQGYIFGSNVLRENIGASELVHRATRLWPFEVVASLGRTNVGGEHKTGDVPELDSDLWFERDNLDAEVLFAGGGNCAILFRSLERGAHPFATALSRRLLERAPGLELVLVHVPRSGGESLAVLVERAFEELGRKKADRRVSVPLLGQGTTVACRSTGLPAVGTDADDPGRPPTEAPRPLSAPILAKLKAVEEAEHRLREPLDDFPRLDLTIPRDLDRFGRRTGDISYIAVVHADGNGMAGRLQRLRGEPALRADDRAFIEELRRFSRSVERSGSVALREVAQLLLRGHRAASTNAERRQLIVEELPAAGPAIQTVQALRPREIVLAQHDAKTYIPFRPLVFGGDDTTFVTDGRLGLVLAVEWLRAFERESAQAESRYARGLTASAGVAIVKVHYPFARAYELAEDLCRSAKDGWNREHSALDWHIASSGLLGRIGQIRAREYQPEAGQLHMRPLSLRRVPTAPQPWRSWEAFAPVSEALRFDDAWRDRRNKVVALRQALRAGPGTVEHFRSAFRIDALPLLDASFTALQTSGWDGAGRCGYFDCIEAMDFYFPLERRKETSRS